MRKWLGSTSRISLISLSFSLACPLHDPLSIDLMTVGDNYFSPSLSLARRFSFLLSWYPPVAFRILRHISVVTATATTTTRCTLPRLHPNDGHYCHSIPSLSSKLNLLFVSIYASSLTRFYARSIAHIDGVQFKYIYLFQCQHTTDERAVQKINALGVWRRWLWECMCARIQAGRQEESHYIIWRIDRTWIYIRIRAYALIRDEHHQFNAVEIRLFQCARQTKEGKKTKR